jgi:glycosyltransferase involved in cell wall biosynthesis
MDILISVFTPTYNRSDFLNSLFFSLQCQTSKSFEWIIVDDGSIDDTESLVLGFVEQNVDFKIIYAKQENQGKHICINNGLELASGELFYVVDSDDILTTDCIEIVQNKYRGVRGNLSVAGVVGRKAYFNGELIGSNVIFEDFICSSIDFRYKFKIEGDMAEVFRTSVLRKYPFPKYENERFCTESLIYNRIAKDYSMLWFSKKIYLAEYLPDGLTSKVVKNRMQSPVSAMMSYSELSELNIPFFNKIKANINFWRFSFNSNYSLLRKMSLISFSFSVVGFPLGFMFYIKDKLQS